MREIWKNVVGLEGIYQVSSLGRVKRVGKSRGAHVGHVLIPTRGGVHGQYLKLTLGRKWGKHYVHRLVAYAFHGSPPTEKHEVNHKNGDTRDNRASNLEWVTRSANNLHSYRELGRQAVVPAGEDQWNSKLTNVDVVAIRKLWDGGGITQREIGERYDVLQTTISRIVMRQSWKHI